MALEIRVLPNDVRTILSASAQRNNYKTAVEELVYNSLDAESSSIAIRVHIQENRIQVIDNGHGIMKNDFEALGQRYMTSKLVDFTALKSIPKWYGYRGEFLANIIEISSNVRIISRHKDGEETWAKMFSKGKGKHLIRMSTRPSKGTTVEIKGFLYNLNIQKRGIDPINDMQNIKSFLEQLSIAHNDLSLSLRDDSKNEIVFKIHKKRDIYQTLLTLFDINKETVQELQVEKGEYKVKGLIGKTDDDRGRHWVYLNGRFIHNSSRLHEVINEYFSKYLLLNDNKTNKSKINHDEDHLFQQNIPFYFVFFSCPYLDYDVTSSHVEFKTWEQINKIVEKLVKLHIGDSIKLKGNKRDDTQSMVKQNQNKDKAGSRGQIEKIINRILKSNSKKLGVSQLQNGVKGKLAKRKNKSKPKKLNTHKMYLNQQKPINFEDQIINRSTYERHESVIIMNNNATVQNEQPMAKKLSESNFVEPLFIVTKKHDETNNIKKQKNKKRKRKMTPKKKACQIVKNKFEKILAEYNNLNINNQDFYEYQRLNEAESAPKRNSSVLQKKEIFMRLINNDKSERKYKNVSTMNPYVKNKYLHNYVEPMKQKKNKYTLENYVMHKIKTKPYKTTYDLVQTILASQQFKGIGVTENSSDNLDIRFKRNPNLTKYVSENFNRTLIKRNLATEEFTTVYQNIANMEKNESKFNFTSKYLVSYTLTCECEDSNPSNNYTNIDYRPTDFKTRSLPIKSTQHSLRCEDIIRKHSDILRSQIEGDILSNCPTASSLTYKSHSYSPNMGIVNHTDGITGPYNNRAYKRFITERSTENFLTTNEKYRAFNKYNERNYANGRYYNKQTQHSSTYVQKKTDESYTIEFTTSNKINYSTKYDDIKNKYDYEYPNCDVNCKKLSVNEYNFRDDETISGFGNTFDIPYRPSSIPSNNDMPVDDNEANISPYGQTAFFKNSGFGKTYTIPCYSISSEGNMVTQNQVKYSDSNAFVSNFISHSDDEGNNNKIDQDNLNIVFVSTSQNPGANVVTDIDLDPRTLCETVYHENQTERKELDRNTNEKNNLDDPLFNYFGNSNYNDDFTDKYNCLLSKAQNNNDDISHHFGNKMNSNNDVKGIYRNDKTKGSINKVNFNHHHTDCMKNIDHECSNDANFNFKDRLRFLPKGMSQIFEKCGSKVSFDYNLEKDYYEDVIYNDFANDVRMQTEVYVPVIQNPEDFTTRDINKFKNRVQKDNTSLVFDEKSLKELQVLNQVDCKFIATIMKKKCLETADSAEYLVLFDQHAVHERIRLERNLADYFNEGRWKSVPLDDVTLKLSKDEILYLHNYKDKFKQLGLEWTILNTDEVSVISIPEAILGKNSREVDKVMKAVKNLLVEEIKAIKLQKGCISLYPKSIMDLVFSEACRYAIKFGDKLTKDNCIELLNDLSNCKTPFQCAHGRPVMAVLLEITNENRDYKIDTDCLRRFHLH